MNLFGVPEAQHYCASFGASQGPGIGSLRKYVATTMRRTTSLKEGTPQFQAYRDCALRDVERSVFIAISNYRRSLDLMLPAASSWAHVTLYYSSFFAARALLGMFGGWIGDQVLIEVAASQPGNQELALDRHPQSTFKGSHERFWDFFYASIAPLIPWIDPAFRYAITPVANSVTWQSRSRNEINYDAYQACHLATTFQASFNPRGFPGCLPGELNTQFSITEGMLAVMTHFVRQFHLETDALAGITPPGTRRVKFERLISKDHAPPLVHRTRYHRLLV